MSPDPREDPWNGSQAQAILPIGLVGCSDLNERKGPIEIPFVKGNRRKVRERPYEGVEFRIVTQRDGFLAETLRLVETAERPGVG